MIVKEYQKNNIMKINGDSSSDTDDLVAVEKKVRVSVNGKAVLSLYCTPTMIREFAAGIIHNEGLISGEWCPERMSIEYGDEITVDILSTGTIGTGERVITSGCGGGTSLASTGPDNIIADDAVFHAGAVRDIFREFQKRSETYKLTGGVHLLAFAEDIIT